MNWIKKLTEPAPEKRFKSATAALSALKSGRELNPHPNGRGIAAELGLQTTASTIVNNNSGQGNLFDNSVPIPHEIQGWNWGAFFLPHIWAITNQVWIGLFAFVPIIGTVMGFVLAAKGNEWAWKSRRWHSIEQFKDHQRAWTKAGLFIGIPMVWIPALYTLFNLF
jgi:hypothetical protein